MGNVVFSMHQQATITLLSGPCEIEEGATVKEYGSDLDKFLGNIINPDQTFLKTMILSAVRNFGTGKTLKIDFQMESFHRVIYLVSKREE